MAIDGGGGSDSAAETRRRQKAAKAVEVDTVEEAERVLPLRTKAVQYSTAAYRLGCVLIQYELLWYCTSTVRVPYCTRAYSRRVRAGSGVEWHQQDDGRAHYNGDGARDCCNTIIIILEFAKCLLLLARHRHP